MPFYCTIRHRHIILGIKLFQLQPPNSCTEFQSQSKVKAVAGIHAESFN